MVAKYLIQTCKARHHPYTNATLTIITISFIMKEPFLTYEVPQQHHSLKSIYKNSTKEK